MYLSIYLAIYFSSQRDVHFFDISTSKSGPNPKLAPCTCLSCSWQSFPFCSVDETGYVFPKPAIEARRGLAEATPRMQKELAQGQSEACGDSKHIILLLKSQQGWTWSSWQLCCLARILSRSWRKGTASRQASRLPQVNGRGHASDAKSISTRTKRGLRGLETIWYYC